MWVTPYQEEDSDEDISYLFTNDLERQEETYEELDSGDEEMENG